MFVILSIQMHVHISVQCLGLSIKEIENPGWRICCPETRRQILDGLHFFPQLKTTRMLKALTVNGVAVILYFNLFRELIGLCCCF